ncbi:MAG: hypothetical protein H0W88_02055 [Parachlamydiaceae bacterium]|nr:hypothetical protein [Parachlamydiaceae bacterium]
MASINPNFFIPSKDGMSIEKSFAVSNPVVSTNPVAGGDITKEDEIYRLTAKIYDILKPFLFYESDLPYHTGKVTVAKANLADAKKLGKPLSEIDSLERQVVFDQIKLNEIKDKFQKYKDALNMSVFIDDVNKILHDMHLPASLAFKVDPKDRNFDSMGSYFPSPLTLDVNIMKGSFYKPGFDDFIKRIITKQEHRHTQQNELNRLLQDSKSTPEQINAVEAHIAKINGDIYSEKRLAIFRLQQIFERPRSNPFSDLQQKVSDPNGFITSINNEKKEFKKLFKHLKNRKHRI